VLQVAALARGFEGVTDGVLAQSAAGAHEWILVEVVLAQHPVDFGAAEGEQHHFRWAEPDIASDGVREAIELSRARMQVRACLGADLVRLAVGRVKICCFRSNQAVHRRVPHWRSVSRRVWVTLGCSHRVTTA
jgi:hypothetical protein